MHVVYVLMLIGLPFDLRQKAAALWSTPHGDILCATWFQTKRRSNFHALFTEPCRRCSGKATGGGYKNPQRADNSNSSSQHARSTAKGDQQSKGWEAPKRVSSSKGQGTCIPRAKADRNKPAAPLHLQKGVEAPAAPGPMQQQVAKQEPESKLDAACTQESLTMPPLSLASPSHMERTTLPMQLQPHQAYQPLPGSPAKRGPSEYSSIGGLSEKRSRARGPSKEEEQVGCDTSIYPGASDGKDAPAILLHAALEMVGCLCEAALGAAVIL
eukprot:1152162-Pelagomonas_calceolata.AAC.5